MKTLSGIRVLDLGTFITGPFSALLLAGIVLRPLYERRQVAERGWSGSLRLAAWFAIAAARCSSNGYWPSAVNWGWRISGIWSPGLDCREPCIRRSRR